MALTERKWFGSVNAAQFVLPLKDQAPEAKNPRAKMTRKIAYSMN
jgi:hypothetical protein